MKTPTRAEELNRDLGFGSVVATESRERLLNRDGSFNVARRGLGFWSSLSLYHWLLTIPWWKFFTLVVGAYCTINALFGVAYFLCGRAALTEPPYRPLSEFWRDFFFSVQTFSTIGYGGVAPVGFLPNIIVTTESLVGLLGLALITGLLFARFSRPTAKIIFSRFAIIAPYRGITAFEFRIANERSSQIIELEAKVIFTIFEKRDGKEGRRFYDLALERQRVAFFPLSWTIVHPIDEDSPLSGLTEADLREGQAEFLILLTGIDETFSQNVHARSSYRFDEVICNAKFANIFQRESTEGRLRIDIGRLHLIERL